LVDRRSVLCVLTHDPKFDVPLLEVALPQPRRFENVSVGINGPIVREAFDLVHAHRLNYVISDRFN
jgi:hypothetical protein